MNQILSAEYDAAAADPITASSREYCPDRDFCAGEYSPHQTCRGHNVSHNLYS